MMVTGTSRSCSVPDVDHFVSEGVSNLVLEMGQGSSPSINLSLDWPDRQALCLRTEYSELPSFLRSQSQTDVQWLWGFQSVEQGS